MNRLIGAITLFILIFLASCQVKEGSTSGGLISGHVPASNEFTLQTPTAGTYVEADVISFSVTFPFNITVNTTGGSPRLALTIGATTRYATYSPQADAKKLSFTYTIVAGDEDADGIDLTALELNGSTLQFTSNGTTTNCAISTVAATNFPLVLVDTTAPTITTFNLTNAAGFYNENDTIIFSMTFSEAVTVTGTPKFVTTLGTGGAVDVNYTSGTGTTTLYFSFTVASTHLDTNGYDSITSPLDLNGGTIVDAVGNNASLSFAALTAAVITYSSTVDINGVIPYVVDVTTPIDGTYTAGQNLDFILEFNRAVTVTATPYLALTIGATARQAQYVSGSGTTLLTFRYSTVPGDVDSDGIAVAAAITQGAGGNIRNTAAPTTSYFSDATNNVITVPSTSGIILNAVQPQATAISKSTDTTLPTWGTAVADNVWIIGQDLFLTVTFNTAMYVDQSGGVPSIPLTIGATTRQATYLSGGNGQTSLIFKYTIVEGDLDSDGSIAIGSLTLNGGVITDAASTNTLLTLPSSSLTSITVDGVKPTISTVTAPANATYSAVSPNLASTMGFTVAWSEAVNYSSTASTAAYLPLTIGATAVSAIYISGNNTASFVHRPASISAMNDSDGIALASPFAGTATIKDRAGNTCSVKTFTPPDTSAILVDTTAPTVSSVVAITANGTYGIGSNLDFSVTFSESVTTVADASYPRIAVTIGATTRYLVATASTTNTVHTFRYTIVAGDNDSNGIALGTSVTSNGTTSYARDGGRNNVTGTFVAPNTASILVDTSAPTVSSRSASSNKSYVSGETLQISVTYSEAVTVDTTGGTPKISIDFDQGTDDFTYASGSGTTTLVFSRLVDGTHFDMTGLPSSVTTITLSGGTIKDAGTNNAPSTFTTIDLSSIYVTYPEVKLWVKTAFTPNLAPPTGAATVSNSGVATTEACGTGTCRTFSGDDALNIGANMNSIDTVMMVFKTPAVIGNHNVFDTNISLVQDIVAGAFDFDTTSATVILDGITLGTNINHDVDMATSSTHVLQVDFDSPQNFNIGVLIPTSFTGAIGEVITIEGVLTAPQKDNIRNYLESIF